jgi:hypothetical protein
MWKVVGHCRNIVRPSTMPELFAFGHLQGNGTKTRGLERLM